MTDTAPIFVRPGDVRDRFGISRSTLYRWAADGKIDLIKRGGNTFVAVDQLKSFIEGLGDQMGDPRPDP